MKTLIRGALAYFVVTFAAATAGVGILTIFWGLFLTSKYGTKISQTDEVIIILIVLLPVSWSVCRWAVRRFAVTSSLGSRIAMGALAFALMMLIDLATGVWLRGEPLSQHIADYYLSRPDQAGLFANVAMALFPAIQLGIQKRAERPRAPKHGAR